MSDWITIGEKTRTLPMMVLRPLRTVSGRVVDRQGKPVADIEVCQSGDGPDASATRTDADGRFSLGGFRQGPVFLFVRRWVSIPGPACQSHGAQPDARADAYHRAASAPNADACGPDSPGRVARSSAATGRTALGKCRAGRARHRKTRGPDLPGGRRCRAGRGSAFNR